MSGIAFHAPLSCARTDDGCAVVGWQKGSPVVKRKWRPALGSDVVFDAAGSGIDADEVGVCWREPLRVILRVSHASR